MSYQDTTFLYNGQGQLELFPESPSASSPGMSPVEVYLALQALPIVLEERYGKGIREVLRQLGGKLWRT